MHRPRETVDISKNDEILAARLRDAISNCAPFSPCFVGFADEREADLLTSLLNSGLKNGCNTAFWGGYEGAERLVLGVFDESETPDNAQFPVKALRIEYDSRFATLTHRDFLGALMGLGISRAMLGDILTDESGATVFCLQKCSQSIKNGLDSVGKCRVRVDFDESGCYNKTDNREVLSAVIASARLDAVISAVLRVSRQDAAELIAAKAVTHKCVIQTDKSREVAVGDRFSVSGKGKFELLSAQVGGKKGKTHITYAKYR